MAQGTNRHATAFCQRSCLVAADDGSRAQGLHCRKLSDKHLLVHLKRQAANVAVVNDSWAFLAHPMGSRIVTSGDSTWGFCWLEHRVPYLRISQKDDFGSLGCALLHVLTESRAMSLALCRGKVGTGDAAPLDPTGPTVLQALQCNVPAEALSSQLTWGHVGFRSFQYLC